MTTEPDDTEDAEDFYEPDPVGLSEGDVMIFDRAEFELEFNCYAATVKDGGLFVLCKSSKRWVPAEGRGQEPKPSGRLTRVQ